MKVTSESEVAQLCLTPSDPMDWSLQGSSVHGVFQARVPEWAALGFSSHEGGALMILAPKLSLTISAQDKFQHSSRGFGAVMSGVSV